MPRWARGWPEALKARAARYALQRWLGPFLEEPLRLEQLGLDLRGGTGTLRELRLQAAAVDELLAGAGAPLELREGAVGAVTVTVPWAALGTEPVRLRLSRLRLVLRPRRAGSPGPGSPPPGGSQRGRDPPPEPPPLEGLEALAVTIDTVLRRLQVLLEDTELRVELPPQPGGGPGGALELHVPRAEYEDGGGCPGCGPPAVLLKGLRLRDPRLLWQELPPPWAQVPVSPPVLGGLLPGPSELWLRLKQNEALPGPAVELEGKVGALHLLLPPPLLGTLRGLLGALDPPEPPPGGRSRPLGPQDLALIERELSRCLRGGRDPPSPPGGDPDSELFYSMTGSLGGGDGAAPPGETPAGSGPPSPAGSPRRRHPSPHSSAPPGRGPPWRGGLRLQVTLGTVTAVLPELGGAPDPAHQHMWAELCDGHAHPALDDALPFPHLRLEVGGAQLGVEPGGPRGGLSLARLELLEELPGAEPHRIQVLRFPAPPTDGPAPTQPVLRLRWGPPGPAPPGAPPLPKAPPPALELGLQLRPLEADLDLGLLERLGPALDALFGHAHGQDAATAEDTRPGHALWAWPLVRWAAPGAELRLWLPLTDLRPTPFRAPPPRLRPESLRVGLGAPRGWAGPVGGALACDCLDVTYEAQDMGTLPVLRAEPGPGPGGACSVPTLEVTVAEAPPRGPPAPPPTPFSARRSIYESHELVLPGTPEELGAFVGGAVGGAPWTLQVTLPRAHLSLSPPELLQRLYNRINNDLLLWDPAGPAFSESPAPSSDHAPSDEPAPSEGTAPSGGPAPFRPCRSALGTDSEEEEEEDEGPGGSPQDLGDTGDLGDPPGPPQSGGAIVVTVPWGRVTADCPPVGGVAGSRLVLELGEGRLCVLPRPGGLRGLSRACVDLRSLILLHGPVPAEGEGPPPPLHPTLVPWDEPAPPPGASPPARMLALAMGGTLSPRGDSKELVVAVALEGVMLRHHPDPPGTPWYSQLLALLALEDEPVLGYTPPTPLTQLHLHLQRCGLDYRPPLPLRVLVTAETLSVTCGSGPDPRPGGLRLLVDDGSVFLSERCGGGALDLQRDFVSVLDVDFLELQLSTGRGGAAGEGGAAPSEELLVAPARLRGRTCADSAAAIARLLRHLGTPPGPPPGPPRGHGPAPGPPAPPERPPGRPEPPPGGEQCPSPNSAPPPGPPRAPPRPHQPAGPDGRPEGRPRDPPRGPPDRRPGPASPGPARVAVPVPGGGGRPRPGPPRGPRALPAPSGEQPRPRPRSRGVLRPGGPRDPRGRRPLCPLAGPWPPAGPAGTFRGPAGGAGPAARPPGAAPAPRTPRPARPEPHLGALRGAGLRARPRPAQAPPPKRWSRPPAVAQPGGPREGPGAADGASPGQGVPAARDVRGRGRGGGGGVPGGPPGPGGGAHVPPGAAGAGAGAARPPGGGHRAPVPVPAPPRGAPPAAPHALGEGPAGPAPPAAPRGGPRVLPQGHPDPPAPAHRPGRADLPQGFCQRLHRPPEPPPGAAPGTPARPPRGRGPPPAGAAPGGGPRNRDPPDLLPRVPVHGRCPRLAGLPRQARHHGAGRPGRDPDRARAAQLLPTAAETALPPPGAAGAGPGRVLRGVRVASGHPVSPTAGAAGGGGARARGAAALAGSPGPPAAAAAGGGSRGGDTGGDPRCHRPRGRLGQRRHRAGDEAAAGTAGSGRGPLWTRGPPGPPPAPPGPPGAPRPAAPAPPTPPRHEERPRPHRGTGGAAPPPRGPAPNKLGQTGSYWAGTGFYWFLLGGLRGPTRARGGAGQERRVPAPL